MGSRVSTLVGRLLDVRVALMQHLMQHGRWTTGGNGTGTETDPPGRYPHERPRSSDEAAEVPASRQELEFDSLDEVDPSEIQTRTDVQLKLGMTTSEFVTRLLDENGGEMQQQAFTEYTDWSSSTVSRVLKDLERRDELVRVQIGRETPSICPTKSPVATTPKSAHLGRPDARPSSGGRPPLPSPTRTAP
jgi:hypothetical protein